MYVTLGRPSLESSEQMIKKGKIIKNPVTRMDYRNAIKIYGKDPGAVKGKTVRLKSIPVKIECDEEPKERYNIILSVDIMYLIGMTLLVIVSRTYTFTTVTYLINRKKNTVYRAIKQVMGIYTGKKHMVEEIELIQWNNPIHTFLVDNEFSALKGEIESEGTKVNKASKEEHVPEVERQIRS